MEQCWEYWPCNIFLVYLRSHVVSLLGGVCLVLLQIKHPVRCMAFTSWIQDSFEIGKKYFIKLSLQWILEERQVWLIVHEEVCVYPLEYSHV